jgi:hypothetical protein
MESPIAIIAGVAVGLLGRAAAVVAEGAGDGADVVDDVLEPPQAEIVAAEASAIVRPPRNL